MKSGPLFLVAGVALLAGLFFFFKPKPEAEPVTPPAPESATAAAPVAAAAPEAAAAAAAAPVVATTPAAAAVRQRVFELVVKDGKLISGPEVLTAREGDQILIRVTSDRNDRLHLHGYDFEMQVKANETTDLAFKATRSGRFEYELHKAHVDLGALEVQPKP